MDNKTSTDNIFLIGMMGAGKTTIGKQLAQQLSREFLDSDQQIEASTGVDIDTIFDIEGEQGFRRRESDILRELVKKRGIVLATGGGIILADENRQLLKDNGLIVYLRASAEHLVSRIRSDHQRPLLQSGDRLAKMQCLLTERELFYQRLADLVFEINQKSPPQVARELRKMIGQVSHQAA